MARPITVVIIAVLGGLLGFSALHAQENVSVEFRVFGTGRDHFENLYYFDGKDYSPLLFNKSSRSTNTYAYGGAPILTIFSPNPAHVPSAPDSPAYISLGSLNITCSLQQGLLLLVAHSGNLESKPEERRYNLFLMEDSFESFSGNSIRVINATSVNLYGKIADDELGIARNQTYTTSYDQFSSKNKATPIAFAVRTSDGARLAMSNDVLLPSNGRVVLILMNPRREGSIRIEVRALMDKVPSGEPEKSA